MNRFIPMWLLQILVARNYRLRQNGQITDAWYWADIEMLNRGKWPRV